MAARSRGRVEAEDIAAASHDLNSRSETARAGARHAEPSRAEMSRLGVELERAKIARSDALRRLLSSVGSQFGRAHWPPTVCGRARSFPGFPRHSFSSEKGPSQ